VCSTTAAGVITKFQTNSREVEVSSMGATSLPGASFRRTLVRLKSTKTTGRLDLRVGFQTNSREVEVRRVLLQ